MLSENAGEEHGPPEGLDRVAEYLQSIAQEFERQQREAAQAMAVAFEGIQEQYNQLAETFATSIPNLTDAFEGWQQQFRQIVEHIDERFKDLEASARQLGAAGWTVPMWAPPILVHGLLEHTTRASEIDESFVHMYTEKRGKQFREMMDRLKRRKAIQPWLSLMEECRYAYTKGWFLVTVPALLAVLEGLVATAGDQLKSLQSPRKTAGAKYKESKGIRALVWASLEAFVGVVFQSHSFSSSRPPVINRHWILHGRDSSSWTKADSLRLFQACDAVTSILSSAEDD
jgi:hypothetical protein